MSHWLVVQTAAPFAGTGHATPHPPQFAVLVAVSTQPPPHGTPPPLHVVLHELDEQTSLAPQTVSHAPQ